MSLEDLGAALAAEREKRHLSIEDVSNNLKISASQIRAIEAGDLSGLPHPAYAKGFIRSYAKWLGINEDEMQKMQAMTKPASEDSENIGMPKDRKSGKSGIILLFLVMCGLIAGAVYYWKNDLLNLIAYNDSDAVGAKLQTADTFMATKEQKTDNFSSKSFEPVPTNETENSQPKTPDVLVIQSAEATHPEKQIAESSKDDGNNLAPEKATTPPEQHKLVITAIEECWVHSNADKTDTRQFSLRKGDTFALTFNDILELKLGNAGGVRLRYDGEDLPAPGTSGQVKTITFPPKNN